MFDQIVKKIGAGKWFVHSGAMVGECVTDAWDNGLETQIRFVCACIHSRYQCRNCENGWRIIRINRDTPVKVTSDTIYFVGQMVLVSERLKNAWIDLKHKAQKASGETWHREHQAEAARKTESRVKYLKKLNRTLAGRTIQNIEDSFYDNDGCYGNHGALVVTLDNGSKVTLSYWIEVGGEPYTSGLEVKINKHRRRL